MGTGKIPTLQKLKSLKEGNLGAGSDSGCKRRVCVHVHRCGGVREGERRAGLCARGYTSEDNPRCHSLDAIYLLL